MRRLFTLLAILLILSMLPLALFGCNAEEKPSGSKTTGTTPGKNDNEQPVLEGTEYILKDNLNSIKINGRYKVTNIGLACDNVGSGIEFQGVMKGKVYLTLTALRIVWGISESVYYTVYVDGVRQDERYEAFCGKEDIVLTLADFGDSEGKHHIRVVKQSEARYTMAQFTKITMDGSFSERPADREYFVEFVGSDLICGLGNYNGTPDQTAALAQTSEYEDGTQSMSFITAEHLKADCSILGVSGMGVEGAWTAPLNAPLYYKTNSYYRNKNELYDFESGRTPDLIVLNIGKNDGNIPVENRPSDAAYKVAIMEFLTFLKQTHGDDVKIIWTYDIPEDDPTTLDDESNVCRIDVAREAIELLGGEDSNIYICQLTTNRLGGQKHTDKAGHVQAAQELLDFIREKGILPVGQ